MVLRMGLKVCVEKECPNNGEILLSTQSVLSPSFPLYCSSCVENGFDYIYSNDSLVELNGKSISKAQTHSTPVEEILLLQRIKRRGLSKRGMPFFGLFSTQEYSPNEVIGFVSGAVCNAIMCGESSQNKDALLSKTADKPLDKEPGSSRCFLFRETGKIIDSRKIGNITRFIRRSCRSNVKIAFEVPEEEWKLHPPLKKSPTGVNPCRAKLYATSRIQHTAELFLNSAHSAFPGEKWICPDRNISNSELLTKCACVSGLGCLFERFSLLSKKKPYLLERSRVSLLLSKMHDYISSFSSLYSQEVSPALWYRCTFIDIAKKAPNNK